MSYHSVLPAEIPSFWAAATVLLASAEPCWRAVAYDPDDDGLILTGWR